MIPTIKRHAAGSTFKEVSATILSEINIVVPAKEVIKKYSEQVSTMFKRQDLLETESQGLTSLRDWLLPMLMNGQVKVG